MHESLAQFVVRSREMWYITKETNQGHIVYALFLVRVVDHNIIYRQKGLDLAYHKRDYPGIVLEVQPWVVYF